MLDTKYILDNKNDVIQKLNNRGFEIDIAKIEEDAKKRKDLIQDKENLAQKKNEVSNSFKNAENISEKEKLTNLSKDLDNQIHKLKDKLEEHENKFQSYLLTIPNIPHDSCPIGSSEKDNIQIRTIGEANGLNINKKEHADILENIKMASFENAITIAQSRFVVLKNKVATLHRALVNYMLDTHTSINNYTECNVPYICNSNSLLGTGQLPKFEEDLFRLSDSELYLIPTGEVPLTNIYRNKIISESDLPILMTANTPCFRSEVGSHGLDTKGMIRQHQFEKVELVQIVHPNVSDDALESITSHACMILDSLELPYQVVELCTGDLGFSSQKTYDIEVWFPSQQRYREISSCSNFGSFQSRRLNIKYKNKNQKDFVHTLNGSGLAIGRTLAALVENNFNGKFIAVPSVLHKYTDFKTIEL